MRITYSIVSHGQFQMILNLLDDFDALIEKDFKIILTINIDEQVEFSKNYGFPITVLRNLRPLGFGANHNQAFMLCDTQYFAVVNPDIRFSNFSLNDLVSPFEDEAVAVVAPRVIAINGEREDSARKFPTFTRMLVRFLGGKYRREYEDFKHSYRVDWVAGMFLILPHVWYRRLRGFDQESFFMYMEDVDICKRASYEGAAAIVNPAVNVIHDARRASKKSLQHLLWHIKSAFKYFWLHK